MVRPTLYLRLWQCIEGSRALPNHKRGLILVGHPGIDKTLCLDLIAAWSLYLHPTTPVIVAQKTSRSSRKNDVENGDSWVQGTESFSVTSQRFWRLTGISREPMQDIKDDVKWTDDYMRTLLRTGYRVLVVVSTSPQWNNYKQTAKDIGIVELF